MNNPSAQILRHDKIGLTSQHNVRGIEDDDGCGGNQEESEEVFVLAGLFESRPHGAAHEAEPEKQADKEKQLPKSAEIDVFISLVPEPEVYVETQLLAGGVPCAEHHSGNDD